MLILFPLNTSTVLPTPFIIINQLSAFFGVLLNTDGSRALPKRTSTVSIDGCLCHDRRKLVDENITQRSGCQAGSSQHSQGVDTLLGALSRYTNSSVSQPRPERLGPLSVKAGIDCAQGARRPPTHPREACPGATRR